MPKVMIETLGEGGLNLLVGCFETRTRCHILSLRTADQREDEATFEGKRRPQLKGQRNE